MSTPKQYMHRAAMNLYSPRFAHGRALYTGSKPNVILSFILTVFYIVKM